MATYAIGDIHGCYDEFVDMLSLINFNDNDTLVLVGDYIDRGRQTYEMLKWIKNKPQNVVTIRGNHEQEFISYIDIMKSINKTSGLNTNTKSIEETKALYDSCLYCIKKKNPLMLLYFDAYGTIYRLIYEFGVNFLELLQYRDIFNSYPYYYKKDNVIFVHAGYIEDYLLIKDKYKSINDFYLYARDDGYTVGGAKDCIIVAGHTPTIEKDSMCYNDGDVFKYYDKTNNCYYYNIDGGIVFRDDDPGSQLCCLRIDDMREFYV